MFHCLKCITAKEQDNKITNRYSYRLISLSPIYFHCNIFSGNDHEIGFDGSNSEDQRKSSSYSSCITRE